MGSHFYGPDGSCHTSNGGAELFFRSLVALSRPQTPVEEQTRDFIRGRIAPGIGVHDFELVPSTEALPSADHLRALALFAGQLARTLTSGVIPAELARDFDREDRLFQLRWAAWAADFFELVCQANPGLLPPLSLAAPSRADGLRLELERLTNRLIHLRKTAPDDREAQLAVIERQGELAVALGDRRLEGELLERQALLHADLAQWAAAGAAFRRAAALADREQRRELERLARDCEAR